MPDGLEPKRWSARFRQEGRCFKCGQTGHVMGDATCPMVVGGAAATTAKTSLAALKTKYSKERADAVAAHYKKLGF